MSLLSGWCSLTFTGEAAPLPHNCPGTFETAPACVCFCHAPNGEIDAGDEAGAEDAG